MPDLNTTESLVGFGAIAELAIGEFQAATVIVVDRANLIEVLHEDRTIETPARRRRAS